MAKVVNVCLCGPYTEGLSYQDNLLPKYQAKNGNDVYVIAPTHAYTKKGEDVRVDECEYVNRDGVSIVRIDSDQGFSVRKRLRTYSKLKPLLEELDPDVIFLHGLQFRGSSTVARYVRNHSDTRLYVDNHSDASNSATNWISKYIQHRILWRHYAKLLEPYTKKFWGVLPARVDFLVENYGLAQNKCDLLVMGADDEEVSRASNPSVRDAVREKYGFAENDFVIVTGGKIDMAKTQTLLLMDAVNEMPDNVKMLMFGPVVPELEDEVASRMSSGKIARIAWASSSDSYDYFSAADAICFPGRHSVYWEQAVAMGKPLIVKMWKGTDHVNVSGNVVFLREDSTKAIEFAILQVQRNKDVYAAKAKMAKSTFLYSEIAKKSIDAE